MNIIHAGILTLSLFIACEVRYTTIMSIFEALLLGIIEGLTEFFPISSTGHLIIAEHLLGISNPSLFFNIVIQLGAILAVLWIYWKKIIMIIQDFLKSPSVYATAPKLMFGTIPALLAGFFLNDLIDASQKNIQLVAWMTIIVAFVLLGAEYIAKKNLLQGKKDGQKSVIDYLIIGIFQAISIIPGVSRSGITITGGILRRFSFHDAADTAFLLAVPIMSAASLFEGLKLMTNPALISAGLGIHTLVAFVAAFLTAAFTIKITLPILKKYGFLPFVIYRVLLGIFLLLIL